MLKKLLAALLLAFVAALPAWGQVVFDTSGNSAYSNAGGTTVAASLTVAAGSNRLMTCRVVWREIGGNPNRTVTGIDWLVGGTHQALTRAGGVADVNPNYAVDIWYVVAPTTGAGTATATLSGSVNSEILNGCDSWSGVSQTTPLGTVVTATGQTASVSLTALGGATNDAVVGVIGAPTFSGAVTQGQTTEWNVFGSGQSMAGNRAAYTTGIVSWSALNNFAGFNSAAAAVAILQSSAVTGFDFGSFFIPTFP